MRRPSDDLMRAHDVLVASDNVFQRRARLLQALWREEHGLPIGLHRGKPLGSRLPMPRAQERLESYLTPTIRKVVRREVMDRERAAGKLFGRPRIFNDLLSSQPLCFNLFGELAEDLGLASRVFRRLLPDRVARVAAIELEWSPGRGDERFTGDNSAFDVFVRCVAPDGQAGFVGIEVKYHESLRDAAAKLRPRYDQVARAMGAFREDGLEELEARPLQQVWRDHLLAGSMLQADARWARGLFVFLHPRDNDRCVEVVEQYGSCLVADDTFAVWTLEHVADALGAENAGAWVDAVRDRYLRFEKVDRVVGASGG